MSMQRAQACWFYSSGRVLLSCICKKASVMCSTWRTRGDRAPSFTHAGLVMSCHRYLIWLPAASNCKSIRRRIPRYYGLAGERAREEERTKQTACREQALRSQSHLTSARVGSTILSYSGTKWIVGIVLPFSRNTNFSNYLSTERSECKLVLDYK